MHEKEKKRKAYTRLSQSQKQEIIRGYHLEGKLPSRLAEEYGVTPGTIRFNLRKFAAENDKSALLMKKETEDEMAKAVRLLEKENLELRKLLRHAEMRADYYETMVDVAEEMFDIEIKKKPAPDNPAAARRREGVSGHGALRSGGHEQAGLLQAGRGRPVPPSGP